MLTKRPPIATWCVGQASSMGSLLLAAGTAGFLNTINFDFYFKLKPTSYSDFNLSEITRL